MSDTSPPAVRHPAQHPRRPLGITEVVLRDAQQSLLATRLRIDDILPVAERLDRVGYWSMESWGGATFDVCIRYLGEDPWDRLRAIKAAMPNTPQQMLLRGQNILGYRHYADDVVDAFVERAAVNGIDVFRIFDAMNDARNMAMAISAVKKQDRHAQGTLSYTLSPVHNLQLWLDLARRLEDMGADSLCIKDMAGLLSPARGYQLVAALKQAVELPIHLQCHATTGLSTATYLKCLEAGIDNVDTAISSMSMTYGHSPTETLVAIAEESGRATGLDLPALEDIAGYFRRVRKKYARFEGSLKGVDSRILVAQVPGGMLTNMENQLREQNAADRLDEVLAEIPRVRKDLGYLPLVTPTSQIVGTQAVLNVLKGRPYEAITRETAAVLRGEYGATPAPVDSALQQRVLAGQQPLSGRPADRIPAEMASLAAELQQLAREHGLTLRSGDEQLDDVLIYALFPQVGLRFIENRGNPAAFEPAPDGDTAATPATATGTTVYTVTVEGRDYTVAVGNGGEINGIAPLSTASHSDKPAAGGAADSGDLIAAPLAGTIVKIQVAAGDAVSHGQPLLVMEAMKMESILSAPRAGVIDSISVAAGDAVRTGETVIRLRPAATRGG
ncbi:MAG: sodium-extruding oxaloacetate decarboxylase subunit alpha [Porticoccaceae bacterium]